MAEHRHCDEFIDDALAPECLRHWLSYHRRAAVLKRPDLHGAPPYAVEAALKWIMPELRSYLWTDPEPVLFATFESKRVRCVMASRFGDIGITKNLDADRGYDRRVSVSALTEFSTEPY
ncbi:hypothetical protein CRBSH125_01690 [Afipia carboxidovorans]|nr:hypothetical protein CRBSH125_01690 [Afipia carboxidovorans]